MLPQIDSITAAILQLAEKLRPVSAERLPLEHAAQRVLAEEVYADRDSPPLNVSAMDGYALRLADLSAIGDSVLSVSGIATAGRPAPPLLPGQVVQIFTGAPVPGGADCIVPRELTLESPGQMQLNGPSTQFSVGMNIRARGENAPAGSRIFGRGSYVSSAAMAGLASVAGAEVSLHRPVQVAIINTGDELVPPGQPVQPWQIRDSNGPTLHAALAQHAWLKIVSRQRVADNLPTIAAALQEASKADAVVLTGGVSMGDTDHVPAAIEAVGGEIVFHRLPIRPGKPVLGAVRGQQLLLGLPGNPVSVAVTARLIALPLLRRLAGMAQFMDNPPRVAVDNSDDKQLKLHWYRLVCLTAEGHAKYLDNRGSGDLVSLAHSDGFVELPAGRTGPGPWRLFTW